MDAVYIQNMDIFTYTDYRPWLLDYYQHRKASVSGFSWREFASICGYASPVYLKLVGEGKTMLSAVGVERVAQAVGLVGRELRYFRALVRFTHAKQDAVKKEALAEMRELAEQSQKQVIPTDQYDYFTSWLHPAVRELAPALGVTDAASIARKLQFKATTQQVEESLRLLLRLGMLEWTAQGFKQTQQSLTTGDEISSLAVREMHRQMAQLAWESLDAVPKESRDISGLTLGVTPEAMERIRKELVEFRRKVVHIATESSACQQVVRLNLQLFPLSHNLQNGEAV